MSACGQAGRGSSDPGQPMPVSGSDLTISDLISASGALPENSTFEAVESWLQRLRESSIGVDAARRALIREAAVERLKTVKCISAPANVADAFLSAISSREDSLQGQALVLLDPEPWPDPVNGAELLDELAATFGRFVTLPEGSEVALALWVVFAHAHDAFSVSPVLAITSPVMRCGKSTLLDLLSQLVPRPLTASNLTEATLFRSIEKFRPTLLIDEGDTFL